MAKEANLWQVASDGTLKNAEIIAFNTHGLTAGQSFADEESEPSLILGASGNSCSGTNVLNDGFLTSSEIMNLDLNAQIVLLTACHSGSEQFQEAGEPLTGLARSFLLAGARNVLISHWQAAVGG